MLGRLFRLIRDLLAVALHHERGGEKQNQYESVYDISGVIFIEFEDGNEVEFKVRNLLEEYIKLRIMWHSSHDMFELIPYINEGFRYQIRRL